MKTAVQRKREKIEVFLDGMEILNAIDIEDKLKIVDALQDEWLEPGEYVIKEYDQNGDKFYMILEGDAYATKILNTGEDP